MHMLLELLIAPEMWVIMLLALLICIGLMLVFWMALRKMKRELAYLEDKCFD